MSFCLLLCCTKHKLPHLAAEASTSWQVAPSMLVIRSHGRSLLVQTFLSLSLGHPHMEGAVVPIRNNNIAEVMCVHSSTEESPLWQLGHHRLVKLPLSHASQTDH